MDIFKYKLSYRVLFIIDAVALLIVQLLQGAVLNLLYLREIPQTKHYFPYWFFLCDLLSFSAFTVAFVEAYRYFTRKPEERAPSEGKPDNGAKATLWQYLARTGCLSWFHISWAVYALILTYKLALIFINFPTDKKDESSYQLLQVTDPVSGFTRSVPLRRSLKFLNFQVCLACASFVFVLLVESHNWHKKSSQNFSYVFGLGTKTGIEIFDSVDMLEVLIKKDYISVGMETAVFAMAAFNFLIPMAPLIELSRSKFGDKVSAQSVKYKILHNALLLVCIDIPFFVVRFHSWVVFRDLSMFMMKNLFNILAAVRGLYLDLVTYNSKKVPKRAEGEEIPLNRTDETQTDGTKANNA